MVKVFKRFGNQSTTAATRLWTDTVRMAVMAGMVALVSLVDMVNLVKITLVI